MRLRFRCRMGFVFSPVIRAFPSLFLLSRDYYPSEAKLAAENAKRREKPAARYPADRARDRLITEGAYVNH